jgi:hypothetical protein
MDEESIELLQSALNEIKRKGMEYMEKSREEDNPIVALRQMAYAKGMAEAGFIFATIFSDGPKQ